MVNIAIIATLIVVLAVAGITEGASPPCWLTSSLFRCSRCCSCITRVPRHHCIICSTISPHSLYHCICCYIAASYTCINCLACLLIWGLTTLFPFLYYRTSTKRECPRFQSKSSYRWQVHWSQAERYHRKRKMGNPIVFPIRLHFCLPNRNYII